MLSTLMLCLVVGIADGDTLTARCGEPGAYEQVKVRLAQIDAPESRQPFGQRSKQSLSDLCFQTQAQLRVLSTERYGRSVARVECRGKDASLEQVRAGLAWAYTQYLTDPAVQRAEQSARAARAGLWSDPAPVPPWQWRRSGGKTVTAPAANPACLTGPRGGTYTIGADGRRNYAGC